jgi:hypothetical protein
MTVPTEKTLVNREAIERIRLLAELLPQLQGVLEVGERVFANARLILLRASESLEYLVKTGLMPALPSNLYLVNENGKRRGVNADTAERLRRTWRGNFLLDLPRRVLVVHIGKTKKHIRLGQGGLHWGIEKVLIVGMSQPGVPFGFYTFSKVDNRRAGISEMRTLTRYIHDARNAIGDSGKNSRYIHKATVDFTESPSRWGYVFDNRWSYLVISAMRPAFGQQFSESTELSTLHQDSYQQSGRRIGGERQQHPKNMGVTGV